MNRLDKLFNQKKSELLSVYLPAGYPEKDSSKNLVLALEQQGVDFIELGMPYSDPLADGEMIQAASQQALDNGMNMSLYLEQVANIRLDTDIPLVWMGYYNQLLQYGDERFFREAKIAGIDAFIIPDLPMVDFEDQYQALFEDLDLGISFLVCPETPQARLEQAARLSTAFLYVVSSASTTGTKFSGNFDLEYMGSLNELNLKVPTIIGFGIHNRESIAAAHLAASGAIIGSAFIRAIDEFGEDQVCEKFLTFSEPAKELSMDGIKTLSGLEKARALDEACELKAFRKEFRIPKKSGKEQIYFCGNSLGLQPKRTAKYITEELQKWEDHGVEAHFLTDRPWMQLNQELKETTGKIVGAKPTELVTMNSLTVNIHLLFASFYQPSASKFKILVESDLFPSDLYALESQVKQHGIDPAEAIIKVYPRPGEKTLRTKDILSTIDEHSESLAIVWLGGINYYTGQLFELEAIGEKTSEHGILYGLDLAHAVANVPLALNEWDVDFATWCTYKYMNSGPGGISQVFVHEKHHANAELPRLSGWWGNNRKTQFLMRDFFEPATGADAYQMSTSPVLLMTPLRASLDVFKQVPFFKVVEKSRKMTAYLEQQILAVADAFKDQVKLEIFSPSEPRQRGSQLSISISEHGKLLVEYLATKGITVDWREPEVIRLAPAPLYNTYEEIYKFRKELELGLELLFVETKATVKEVVSV